MMFDISQLKKIRKKLDLTQHKFAREIGISQSMIAKIESGKLDPTYSKVKQIESGLQRLMKEEEKSVEDIMVRKIISVGKREEVKKVIGLMQKMGISQLPVVDRGGVIGIVSESSILSREGEISSLKVEGVMGDSPPIVSKDAGIEIVKVLLKFYSLVLVKERGKLIGLVTRSDLIRGMV